MSTPPTDGTLAVGIVGTGGISRAHAPGWLEAGAQLHAYSHQGADRFAAEFPAIVHPTLDALLEAVDVVDVCTPTPDHAEPVHRALDAGLDALCEKPLTLTVEAAQRVVEHAERDGRLLVPAHVVRYFPQYAAAKRAIEDGRIGTPAVLRFERTGTFPTQDWFGDESRSGGIVMDQMIHDLDQAIWMAGPVESVYARQHTARSTDRVRTAHVTLRHRGGAISHCRGLWGATGTAFRYTFHLARDRGRLEYDSARNTGVNWDDVASSRRVGGDGFLPDVATMRSPYVEEILDAHAAITRGTTPRVTARDGLYAVQVAHAALESIATKEVIAC